MKALDVARYWSWVAVSSPDECWPWTGTKNSNGYGVFRYDGRTRGAHRVGFAMANGTDVDDAHVVRHSCDNRECQNPAHLLSGTQADNMADMVSRGRQRKGETNPRVSLTAEQVKDIATRYALGNVSQRALAQEFRVQHSTIGRIVRGRTWRSVEKTDATSALESRKFGEVKAHRGEAAGRKVLTAAKVQEIRRRFAAGETNKAALARDYGVDRTNIDCVVRRRTWTHIE